MEILSKLSSRLEESFEQFVLKLADYAPLLILVVALPWLLVRLSGYSRTRRKAAMLEVIFFSILGVAVAHLTILSQGSILANLLPSLIVAVTFVLQLLGRASIGGKVPLNTRSSFLSGTASVATFIVSYSYLLPLIQGTITP